MPAVGSSSSRSAGSLAERAGELEPTLVAVGQVLGQPSSRPRRPTSASSSRARSRGRDLFARSARRREHGVEQVRPAAVSASRRARSRARSCSGTGGCSGTCGRCPAATMSFGPRAAEDAEPREQALYQAGRMIAETSIVISERRAVSAADDRRSSSALVAPSGDGRSAIATTIAGTTQTNGSSQARHGRAISVRPRNATGPAVGSIDAGDDVEEGRLAGAVRPDEADDRALRDVEVDVVDGDQAAEPLRDVRRASRRSSPLGRRRRRAASPRRRRSLTSALIPASPSIGSPSRRTPHPPSRVQLALAGVWLGKRPSGRSSIIATRAMPYSRNWYSTKLMSLEDRDLERRRRTC